MPRIKLTEKETYRFKHEHIVKISNLNQAGHVGNAQMADLIHDGRITLLKSLGLNELNLGDGKTGIIMGDLVINFKSEIFYDDKILIESDIAEIEENSIRFCHRISKNGKTAAVAETGFVAFDYSQRKIAKITEIFLQKLSQYNS